MGAGEGPKIVSIVVKKARVREQETGGPATCRRSLQEPRSVRAGSKSSRTRRLRLQWKPGGGGGEKWGTQAHASSLGVDGSGGIARQAVQVSHTAAVSVRRTCRSQRAATGDAGEPTLVVIRDADLLAVSSVNSVLGRMLACISMGSAGRVKERCVHKRRKDEGKLI